MLTLFYGVISSMSLGSKKKSITIEYYKVCSYDTDENDSSTAIIKECEISYLLEKFQKEDAQNRTINYIGEYVILSTIEYDGKWFSLKADLQLLPLLLKKMVFQGK